MKLISIQLFTQDGELFDLYNTEQEFLKSPYHSNTAFTIVYAVSHNKHIFNLTPEQWRGEKPLPF